MHDQHTEQLQAMTKTLRERRPTEHLKFAPYKKGEDTQDLLDAFKGIIELQQVLEEEWILRFTPLLKGKACAVCAHPETTGAGYDAVKIEIMSAFSINSERSMKQF
uniref:Uncharacterized protein n=1 Tax=Amphimedon queenslandica TaxID=400682 RepID=A0A1X7UCQ8_AMPQE